MPGCKEHIWGSVESWKLLWILTRQIQPASDSDPVASALDQHGQPVSAASLRLTPSILLRSGVSVHPDLSRRQDGSTSAIHIAIYRSGHVL